MLWIVCNDKIMGPGEDRGNWSYPGKRTGSNRQSLAMALLSSARCVQGRGTAPLWSEHGARAGTRWQEMRLLAKAGTRHQGPVGHAKEHGVRKGGLGSGEGLCFRKILRAALWRRHGGGRMEVHTVGTILRWPLSIPAPRVHIQYDPLP